MPDEQQSEFFKEFLRKKGGIEKIAEKITEKRKRFYINLPLENIVFGLIIAIVCVIVAFALGVERGKRLIPIAAAANGDRPYPDTILHAKSPASTETVSAESVSDEPIPLKPVSVEPAPETRYTIQLISYTQQKPALREKKELLSKKIDAFIIKSDKWYQLCAGGYNDMKEASAALKKFKKDYKGCFIRNRTKDTITKIQ